MLTQFTQALQELFLTCLHLYSYSYVLATSVYNTQYLNKFYHYYLSMLFIFNVVIYNFQIKNLYVFFVVFVQYKNWYFFVVVPLADISKILICLYIFLFASGHLLCSFNFSFFFRISNFQILMFYLSYRHSWFFTSHDSYMSQISKYIKLTGSENNTLGKIYKF